MEKAGYAVDRCDLWGKDPAHEENCWKLLDYANRVEIIKHGRSCYTYPTVAGYEHITYRQALSVISGHSEAELERIDEEFCQKHPEFR